MQAPSRWKPLTGGTAVWIFMGVEVLTFGLFMLGHAWGWRTQAAVFADSQSHLHLGSGVRGTAFLLIGSWFAYQAVLTNARSPSARSPTASNHTAQHPDNSRATAAWFLAAAVAGLAFTINKLVEYSSPELAGITLSTNDFWFSYLFLTGLHLLHVVGGVGFLAWLALRARAGDFGPDKPLTVQAGAAYWHLVDVVWVLLFPVLYGMHP